eukprot:2550098-Pleurochrysis_carterae.AAC.1
MAEPCEAPQAPVLPASNVQTEGVGAEPVLATPVNGESGPLPAQPAAVVAAAALKETLARTAGAQSIQPGCTHWILSTWPEAFKHMKPFKPQLIAEMIRRDATVTPAHWLAQKCAN